MEEQCIKDFEKYDNKLLKDYMSHIRTKIFNELEDFRKINDKFNERLVFDEVTLLYNFKNYFKDLKIDNSEEAKRLNKLFEIYSCLRYIFDGNRCSNEHLNYLKSLIKD